MIRRRLIFVLGWLLMSANLSFAAISTTQQNFDDFSFKKGFKATGGLSFSNNFYAVATLGIFN